jgi:MoxR-like ATPase
MAVSTGGSRNDLEIMFQRRVRARLVQLIDEMSSGLVERDTAVRLALLAALAGEHMILVGPPGTAKSEIARRLSWAFRDATYFERLMTRFSVPEELFGPLSLKALERDEYTRLTAGYLPTAAIAFLDEVFKANSAILNALLGILNERVFDNGVERTHLPLISLVGASNEIPTSEELLALYDRFLIRCQLEPVSARGFGELLGLEGQVTADRVQARVSLKVLEKIRLESARVRISVSVRHALQTLREWLQSKSIYVSDRRWMKIVRLLRVAAYTEGRTTVLWPDCWLLQHCLWSRPEQHPLIRDWFDANMLELVRREPDRLGRLVTSIEEFATAPAARIQRKDAAGRALYHAEDGSIVPRATGKRPVTTRDGDPLYIRPGDEHHSDPHRALTAAQIFDQYFSSDLDGFDDYVSDLSNQLYTVVPLEPVLQVAAGEEASTRAAQLEELEADLGALLVALAQDKAAFDMDPLWLPRPVARSIGAAMKESTQQLTATLLRLNLATKALARTP